MPPEITREDLDGVMRAIEEFKTTVDARDADLLTKGAADALYDEKIGKLNATIDTLESKNQELTREVQQQALKTQQAIEQLEIKLARPGLQPGAAIDGPAERKAKAIAKFDGFLRAVDAGHRTTFANLSEEQKTLIADIRASYKALNITDDTGGGYLAPVEFVPEILKSIVLLSPVRALAKIRTTANKQVHIPKRTATPAAVWEGETDNPGTTGQSYGALEIFARKLRAMVDISQEDMEDSAFDLAAETMEEIALQFAVAEGAAFVNGSGAKQMEGFLVNSDVIATGNVTKSGNATQLTADAFIQQFHALKSGYVSGAVWVMNRATVGLARQLKDSVGAYLFLAGLPNGVPNTFLGAPYVEVPDMPNVGAGAYPVAFGDFNRGYRLVDRVEMSMLRDPYTQADSDLIRYRFRKRLGGAVTMPEAIKPMLISA